MDLMSNVNFTLSSNNKNKLSEFYVDLNEESITATNILDDYASELKVDYLSSAIVPSEAGDGNQEHLAAIRYSKTPLVSWLLGFQSYVLQYLLVS